MANQQEEVDAVPRCEGWRRRGGMFTFGLPEWRQCENPAIVILKVKQTKTEELPACLTCWNEAKENGIKILSAEPIKETSQCPTSNRK